ncbi:MAG: sulfate reduction electron transfer complex DsrMKJOP subunit DsrM [Nitrospirae bacterium]|nr:sulfate reduction electron transfer complex DsrMKJOP subunit DsrM [Nitrospirota bacterium]MBI4838422.1 sulfate reduction electron transfer complex DsrMKJOP subunit DsrM [Nitrospirota bacterium]
MNAILSLIAVIALILIALLGVKTANLHSLFGIAVPYAAMAIFLIGVISRVLKWGRSPVPFCIPTTCGQQKSLPWIKQSKLDNPSTTSGVIGRMLLEVLLFRSLFSNTAFELRNGPKVAYGSTRWLWLGGLAFHWSFLVVLIRHLRLFTEPVPACLSSLEVLDGFLQIGAPGLLLSGVVLLLAVTYLFLRRVLIPEVRYISLAADYFPLFLILSIALSGIIMRYFTKVDIVGVKALTLGLVSFNAVIPEGISVVFYIHLFLVSALLAYIPFSKIMHLGGVLLSPTRNMPNNSRMERHINPWNYPVHVHTYEEYENDFREKMKSAGIPVEKE